MAATTDEKSESDSEMLNIYEGGIFQKNKIGLSNSLLLPPGTVIAAANTTVALSAATKDKEDAVSFHPFLAFFNQFLT